jgi:hypothetical protein
MDGVDADLGLRVGYEDSGPMAAAILTLMAHSFPECGPSQLEVELLGGGWSLVASYRTPGDKADSRLMVRLGEGLSPKLALVLAARHVELHLTHVAQLALPPDAPMLTPAEYRSLLGDNVIPFPHQVPPRDIPVAVDAAWRLLAAALVDDLDRMAEHADTSGFNCDVLDRLWLCPNCGRDEAGLVVTLDSRTGQHPGRVLA